MLVRNCKGSVRLYNNYGLAKETAAVQVCKIVCEFHHSASVSEDLLIILGVGLV